MKGVYLGACRAYHPNYDLDYNDIIEGYHNNIICDMMDVDLSCYDFIVATPPCNWWSRGNWRRNESEYSLKTRHLLPDIIKKCVGSGKIFIVENVRNYSFYKQYGIIDYCNKNGVFIYYYGRHTYFTNLMLNLNNIPQEKDNIQYRTYKTNTDNYRQGGYNVHQVIEYFLKYVNELLTI